MIVSPGTGVAVLRGSDGKEDPVAQNSVPIRSATVLDVGRKGRGDAGTFQCEVLEHASYVLLPAAFIGLIPLGLALNAPWLGLLVGAVIAPWIDELIGRQEACVTGPSVMEVRVLLVAMVLVLGWSLTRVVGFENWLDVVLAAGSSGYILGAIGIAAAHELGHRRNSLDKSLGLTLLACIGYAHYQVSHHRHHVRVGLPDDPATAHREENLYQFFPRYMVGIWRDANAMVARFRGHRRHAPALLLAGSGLLLCAIGACFGAKGAVFWLVQAAVGLFLIGSVDYIQHWGLRRRLLENGRYERAGPAHAWESPYWLSERFTFNLTRHGFHHLMPTKEAYSLQRLPAAPQMPYSYGTTVLLAGIPFLFRKIMEPHIPADA